MSDSIKKFMDDLTDPVKRKKRHEEYERKEAEKRHKQFLEDTKCSCGGQMLSRGSWSKGETVFGGRNYSTTLYQCPDCKNVQIL